MVLLRATIHFLVSGQIHPAISTGSETLCQEGSMIRIEDPGTVPASANGRGYSFLRQAGGGGWRIARPGVPVRPPRRQA